MEIFPTFEKARIIIKWIILTKQLIIQAYYFLRFVALGVVRLLWPEVLNHSDFKINWEKIQDIITHLDWIYWVSHTLPRAIHQLIWLYLFHILQKMQLEITNRYTLAYFLSYLRISHHAMYILTLIKQADICKHKRLFILQARFLKLRLYDIWSLEVNRFWYFHLLNIAAVK